jgi:glycerate kinase
VDPFPARLTEIKSVTPPIITRLPEVIGLADVETRLTGPEGAIYTFGPQKGLSPEEVRRLDLDLQALVKRLQLDLSFADSISSGAAGGFGYGIQTFLRGKLVSGFQLVAERLALAERIEKADVVITGEGKIDFQSLQGKGPFGVATIAKRLKKAVWAVAGVIEDHELVSHHFQKLRALVSGEVTIPEALAQPKALLHQRTRELLLEP